MPQIILVEKSTVIPATPARLYKSLTDAKELSRWLADRVESDPQQGGQITIGFATHEKRGEYRRLIPGSEVGISWTRFDEPVPIDLTGFRLDKVAQGTRVRVVDFAAPEDAAEVQNLWTQRLKRLKKLYPAKSATKKATAKKFTVTKAAKRKATTMAKTKLTKRKTAPQKAKKK
jgi:uncharacterized protein YndB with AHSA1/START domain